MKLSVFLVVILLGAVFLNMSRPSKVDAYTTTQIQFNFYNDASHTQWRGMGMIQFGVVEFGVQYSVQELPDYEFSYFLMTTIPQEPYTFQLMSNTTWNAPVTILKDGDVYPVIWDAPPGSQIAFGMVPVGGGVAAAAVLFSDRTYVSVYYPPAGGTTYMYGTWTAGAWFDDPDPSNTPVPEPATILLLSSALLGAAGFRKRRARHGHK